MRWQDIDDLDDEHTKRPENSKVKKRNYEEDALPVKKKSGKRSHRKKTFKDDLLEEYAAGRVDKK